jgi:hypothetical protein
MTARILGIYREHEHSPGMAAADRAILDAVLDRLAALNFSVVRLAPAQLAEVELHAFDLVLTMCKSKQSLQRLAAFEREGMLVINSTLAIRNCCRDLLEAGLSLARVPAPPGKLLETRAPIDRHDIAGLDLERGIFVKSADHEALGSHQVIKIQGMAELRQALSALAAKGLRRAYAQQAVEGTEVKFYGVHGGRYFAAVPDIVESNPALGRALAAAANRTAETLGVEVWGGDAIVNGSKFAIIDFNDWPSFTPVRESAARAIALRCVTLLERTGRFYEAKA